MAHVTVLDVDSVIQYSDIAYGGRIDDRCARKSGQDVQDYDHGPARL